MKKNYRVFITNGTKMASFTMLGNSKSEVKQVCDIAHLGSGWSVEHVSLAMKNDSL